MVNEKEFEILLERYNDRTKFILGELDRLERKIDRDKKDFWKYLSDLQKALETSKLDKTKD